MFLVGLISFKSFIMDYEETSSYSCILPPTDNKQQIATLPYFYEDVNGECLPEVANAYTDTDLFQKR